MVCLPSGCSCEQVNFEVVLNGKNLGAFVSLNFEGRNPEHLLEVRQKVMGDLLQDERVKTMGYPEFLIELAKTCTAC